MADDHSLGDVYEIRLQGHLDERRAQQFEGLTLMQLPTGETVLTGPVADQAALHGILARIRDMGVHLLGVSVVREDEFGQPVDEKGDAEWAG